MVKGAFSTALRDRVTREIRNEDAKKAAPLMKSSGYSREEMENALVSNWDASPEEAAQIAEIMFQPSADC